MNPVRTLCGLSLLMLGGWFAMHASEGGAEPARAESRVLRHVVFFKFKADATAAQIEQVEREFRALPGKIDAIRDFEWGKDVSVEKLSKGFTHCFFVTFADEQGRDAYLPHPAHEAFVAIVKPLLDDVCVVDYWSSK